MIENYYKTNDMIKELYKQIFETINEDETERQEIINDLKELIKEIENYKN